MFNTFGFLATKQILLYVLKNVLNPIFIRLEEESLLVIYILASIFEYGLYQVLIISELILNKGPHRAQLLIEYPMSLSEKLLKMSSGKPRLCEWSHKDMLGKRTQASILSQPEKIVRINNITANADNLKANGLEVI